MKSLFTTWMGSKKTDNLPSAHKECALLKISAIASALMAGLLIQTRFVRGITADALMPALNSLYMPSVFFWRQDRYGMVLAHLVRPIKNPLYNLMTLSFLHTALSILSLFLAARFLMRKNKAWPFVGWLSLLTLLATGSHHFIYETFGLAQFFTPALALGLLALICIEDRCSPMRMVLGSILMGSCGWLNFSTPGFVGLWLSIQTLVDAACQKQQTPFFKRLFLQNTNWQLSLLYCMGGALIGTYLHITSPFHTFDFSGRQSMTQTFESLLLIVSDFKRELSLDAKRPLLFFLLATICVLGLGVHRIFFRHERQETDHRALASALWTAVAFAWLVSGSQWVRQEQHGFRFLAPSFLLLLLCGCSVWAPIFHNFCREKNSGWLNSSFLVGGVVTIALRFGAPDPTSMRSYLQAWAGEMTPDVIALGATHIGGDYWLAWPRMFHANLTLYEQGETRRVWAMANRFEQTMALWPSDKSLWRVAISKEDPSVATTLKLVSERRMTLLAQTRQMVVVTPHTF